MGTTPLSHKNGIFLVIGCSIGAGMLGLPLSTLAYGFFPSVLILFLAFLFMLWMGFYILELKAALPGSQGLAELYGTFLGPFSEKLTSFLFLCLFSLLMTAYLSAGGFLIASYLSITPFWGILGLAVLLLLSVIGGSVIVFGANRFFVYVMAAAFCVLLFFGFKETDLHCLENFSFSGSWKALPVMVVSFGYHNLLMGMAKKTSIHTIRTVLIYGASGVFLIYCIWQFVLLNNPLIYVSGEKGDLRVDQILDVSGLTLARSIDLFSFSAIFSSFLTIFYSCIDYVTSLGIKGPRYKIALLLLIFPLFAVFSYPDLFLAALGLSGGFVAVSLFGFLPLSAVRKKRKMYPLAVKIAPGGNVAWWIALFVAIAVFIIEGMTVYGTFFV